MPLGTHTSTLTLTDLGGSAIAPHPLPREWAACEWTRALSETSTATAELMVSSTRLRELIEPWSHVLTVHRNGELVWTGPVIVSTAQGSRISLECSDPTILFSRRAVQYEMSWTNHDVAYIAAEVIRSAVGGSDPYGVVASMIVAPMGESRYASYYIAPDTKLVSEVLSDLVDLGLQWTYSGGRLFIGPVFSGQSTAPVTESHLSSAIAVSKDGSAMVTSQLIRGKGVSGRYTDTASPLRLDGIDTVDAITNSGACFDEARRRVKTNRAAPYRIVPGSSRLLSTAPVEVGELHPGVGVPLSVARMSETVDTVLQVTGVTVVVGSDAVDVALDTMPAELEPQEFAAPESGAKPTDDIQSDVAMGAVG